MAVVRFKGGAGSGNFGHSGRPGKVGGSGGSGKLQILSDNIAEIDRGIAKTIIQGGDTAIELYYVAYTALPAKAKYIIDNSKDIIRFTLNDRMDDAGEYVYSGGHRITIKSNASVLSMVEEFGHLLDKELGGKAEYSRKRAWRDLMAKEDARPKDYKTGLATEDFAKTFTRYVLDPAKSKELYPLHHQAHIELFGEVIVSDDISKEFDLVTILRFKGGAGSGNFGHEGRPGKVGGSGSGGRVWQGQQVDQPRQLTNEQTGAIGEYLAAKALEDKFGVPFSTMNLGRNNAPIDLAGDHTAVEVKAGPASNGPTAQHWRATSSTPGKKEQELLRQMSKEEKRAHHDFKRRQVLDRKYSMLNEMSQIAGAEVKPMTVAAILTPDGKRGDVFMIPGFHQRLPWKQYATAEYYVGTYDVPIEQFKERTVLRFKGGAGSGHWGHAGRPPVEGGSIPGLLMSNTFVNPDFFRIGPGKKLFQDMEDPENIERLIATIEVVGNIRNQHFNGLDVISDKSGAEPWEITEEYAKNKPEFKTRIGTGVNGWYVSDGKENAIRLNPNNVSMSHTFIHELGHHVTLSTGKFIGSSKLPQLRLSKAYESLSDVMTTLPDTALPSMGLRNYSMVNFNEFMADSFKVYAVGTKSQKRVYEAMMKQIGQDITLDELFGGD